LTYAYASGLARNKAQYMAPVTSGPAHYETFEESDVKITIYGKVAVLTGFEDVKPAKGGKLSRSKAGSIRQEQWTLADGISRRACASRKLIQGSWWATMGTGNLVAQKSQQPESSFTTLIWPVPRNGHQHASSCSRRTLCINYF
jgi:hypothetical protein